MSHHKISVVIPSFRRHRESMRAAMSALGQTLAPLEVIVANDGPDSEKGRLLATIGDDRLRFVEAPRRGNPSATRNFGVQHASGDWIALLDDDDVWLPQKLEQQFSALSRSGARQAIIVGVEFVHLGQGKARLRPTGVQATTTAAAELLFSGAGGVNTSTIVAPADTFHDCPFNEEAERHEDWEWLLAVGQKLPLVVCPEVVCERWLRPGEGLSRPGGYEYTWSWYLRNRTLIPAKNRGWFASSILSRKAAYDGRFRALPTLLRELAANRALTPSHLGRLATPWLVPARLRQRLRRVLADSSSVNA